MSETIWCLNYADTVYLNLSPDGLELTAVQPDQETTVVLHPEAVRKLRLALQRFERGTFA